MSGQALGARHQRVQRLRRLVRRASVRSAEHAFVAEGIKVVTAALDSGASIESLYVAADGAGSPAIEQLVDRALMTGARVFRLGAGVMERVADTVSPQPVCAVIDKPTITLEQLFASGKARPTAPMARLVVVCIDVRDPGNLGAVMRSAAAAGAAAIVCCDGTADPFNPKTVRASAGSVFSLPIGVGAPAETLAFLRQQDFRLIATTPHEGRDYAVVDLTGDIALVLGNEASGLPTDVIEMLDERVSIPMAPGTESLNVAMTATVLSHEIARRRRLS
ncbi:MAG: TrmH family RNA methyltransferase [Acidimicrobiales bacterium]